jgi:hypothetical protein
MRLQACAAFASGTASITGRIPCRSGKRVLRIYRGAGHCSGNRTFAEKKRGRIDANPFISYGSSDIELAGWTCLPLD